MKQVAGYQFLTGFDISNVKRPYSQPRWWWTSTLSAWKQSTNDWSSFRRTVLVIVSLAERTTRKHVLADFLWQKTKVQRTFVSLCQGLCQKIVPTYILTWASMHIHSIFFWMEPTRWFLMAKDGGSNFLDGFTRWGESMSWSIQCGKSYKNTGVQAREDAHLAKMEQ